MTTNQQPPETTNRMAHLLTAGGVLLLVIAIGAALWLLRPPSVAPVPKPAPPQEAAAAPAPEAPAPTVAPAPEPAPVETTAPARRAARKPKAAPPAVAASALLLRVDSDVTGASVFVDRVYLGQTPFRTSDVTPGTHVVTVAAEGYESQANTVEINGSTDLMVRFKVVRLSESIPVVHKHAIGSCEGRLIADAQGLRYATANRDHAMAIPFAALKTFEIEYLKKNLRVTRSDGKTFNFTDRTPNGDALFAFHEKVAKARARLAAGVPAAEPK